jgi:hypothetical protein
VNDDEPVRSSEARAVAELALARVAHHCGQKPGFVLLGGLVPQLLCSNSAFRHAGTTDVDVQVDLEIARGATHTGRLEQALINAEFRPDSERVWRWEMWTSGDLLMPMDTLAKPATTAQTQTRTRRGPTRSKEGSRRRHPKEAGLLPASRLPRTPSPSAGASSQEPLFDTSFDHKCPQPTTGIQC